MRQTGGVTEPETEDRRSWFPLALAGGFVLFALTIALFAYLGNDTSDPAKARTVSDVARLAVQAVDEADSAFARSLNCRSDGSAPYVGETGRTAEVKDVAGDATGSFHLSVPDLGEFDVTVGKAGERSCIEGLVETD